MSCDICMSVSCAQDGDGLCYMYECVRGRSVHKMQTPINRESREVRVVVITENRKRVQGRKCGNLTLAVSLVFPILN